MSFSGSGQHSKEASQRIRERTREGTYVFWPAYVFDIFFHCSGHVEPLKVLVNVLTNELKIRTRNLKDKTNA